MVLKLHAASYTRRGDSRIALEVEFAKKWNEYPV